MSDINNTTRPVAKKPHKCIWCGETIEAKTQYVRWTGVFEGDFQSNAYHPECHAAAATERDFWEDGFEPYSFARGTTFEAGSMDDPRRIEAAR